MKPQQFSNSFHYLWLSLLLFGCTSNSSIHNSQKEIATNDRILALTTQFKQSPSEPARLAALNQLASLDRSATIQLLAVTLPQIETWPLLTRACELAGQFQDPALIDPLIQSLARPATTFPRRERPEVPALEQICQQKLETILESRLFTTGKTAPRVAAMDLLCELQNPAQVIQLLLTHPPDIDSAHPDSFLATLQWWAKNFGTLPTGLQETSWVVGLYSSATKPWLLRAIARHDQLRTQADYIIAPRFVALLANVNDSYLPLTRAQLLADIQQKLTGKKFAHRPPSYPGAPDDYQPTLAAQQKNLSRCDLFALETILDALNSPSFTQQIQSLGNADRLDPTTEHGGLLIFRDAALWPKIYPPLYAASDNAYLTSDALLADTSLGLAQFHFHFQQMDNESNAGPGRGDLDYVRQAKCNAVVFTSISATSFDATYYTPTGAILDLGVWNSNNP